MIRRFASNGIALGYVAGIVLGACASTPLTTAGPDVPHGIDLVPMRAVFHTDARVLWLGDSYAIPYEQRVPGGSLLSWPIDRWTAFSTGDGPNWFCARFEELSPGISTIDGGNLYRLHAFEPGSDPRFGLPMWRLRELVLDGSGTAVPVLRYRMTNYAVGVGTAGAFVRAGDTAAIRPILIDAPGSSASASLLSIDGIDAGSGSFDPRSGVRPSRVTGGDPSADPPAAPVDGQAFTSPIDYAITATPVGELDFTLSALHESGTGPGVVLPAGFVAYRTADGAREPGLYFSALADGSWAYAGFGSDTESGTPGFPSKVFSRQQLAHWLDATTIDPTQPVYAFYLVNVEDISPSEVEASMEAMIDQTAGAAGDAGIASIRHCIVIPWRHRISGQDLPGRFPEQRDAAYAIAARRADVSAVSIYDATEGLYFDGGAASLAWLESNGYDDFQYGGYSADLVSNGSGANGGLLDIFRSHPEGRDAGAFFAHIISESIVDACPADFAPPYGVLDLADIGSFVTGFVELRDSVDLSPPIGVWDLADLQRFVASFAAGCAE